MFQFFFLMLFYYLLGAYNLVQKYIYVAYK